MGTLDGALGGIHHDHLKDNVALDQCLFARQSELAGAQQGVFNGMDSAADGGLAETISLTDMGLSTVLAPVHHRDQKPVLQAMGLAGNGWRGVHLWANAAPEPYTWPERYLEERRSAA